MTNSPIISVRDLTKTFGSFTAVDAISFDVAQGEIFGFLGANGAGKTTAMKMLCGLLSPSSGTATVAGFDLATQTENVKRRIGYMSQKFSLYEDLSVAENIQFYGGIYGLTRQSVDATVELNVLCYREILIQRELLAHVANATFYVLRLSG